MRIDQFRYLVTITRFGSISIAAKHLHVSQPTISHSIMTLEKDLNTKIFYRSKHGVVPTENGKFIIQKAKEIINKVEEIKETSFFETITGKLSLGAIPSLCISLLPKSLAMFRDKFSNVIIDIFEGGSFQIEDTILAGKTDLGFIAVNNHNDYRDHKELMFESISLNNVMAYVGKDSPLTAKKTTTFSEIIKHPIVTFNPEYKMYQRIIKNLEKHGEPNIFFTSGNTEASKQIISEGNGVGFCTDLNLTSDPYFSSGKLIPIPISDEDMSFQFGWLRLKNQHLSVPGQEFIKVFEKFI